MCTCWQQRSSGVSRAPRRAEKLLVWVLCDNCPRVFSAFLSSLRKFCSRRCSVAAKAFSPEKFWARVDKRGPDECWPWIGGHDNGDGYGRAYDGKRTRQAHDIAWELSTGKKLRRGRLVRHTCDNPPCCNPRHLLEGTHRDNFHDSLARGGKRIPYLHFPVPLHRRPTGERHGTHTHPESIARGERAGNSKLTRRRVAAIRRVREREGLSYPKLARRFRMSVSQTYRIVKGESWAWLKGSRK